MLYIFIPLLLHKKQESNEKKTQTGRDQINDWGGTPLKQ